MRKSSRKTYRFGRFTEPEFRPYVTALGQATLAWNDLQEMLAILFWSLMGFDDYSLPLSVWYSTQSDRGRRKMLEAIVKTLRDERRNFGHTSFAADMLWLLGKIDYLEDARNDAVHSPLISWPFSTKRKGLDITPSTFLGNPRAASLIKKTDLLSEFRWCRDTACALADFVQEIDRAVHDKPATWPAIPKLPNRGQKKVR